MRFFRNLATIFSLLLVLQPDPANAGSVVQTSTCQIQPTFQCITGIANLQILGQAYDMKVQVGSFENLFPNPESKLASWSSDEFAAAAQVAIYLSLASQANISTASTKFFDIGQNIVDGNGIHSQGILHLPTSYEYANDSPTGAFSSSCLFLRQESAQQGQCWFWSAKRTEAFAVFGPAAAPIPEPSTWLMAGVGLFALGFRYLRRSASR